MAVFRKLTEEEQAQLGLNNLAVLLSTRSSEDTLTSVLAAITNSNPSGEALHLEETQLLVKACLDLIKGNISDISIQAKLLQVDSVGNTTYLGYAAPGADVVNPVWGIKKVVETGGDAEFTWADGDNVFDNIWNDRLTLTYS